MEHVITLLLSIASAVMAGVILTVFKKLRRKAEKQDLEREERELLTLEALNAIFSVTKELTACVLDGRVPDGELDTAYKYQQKIKHKVDDYLRRKAAS